MAPGFSKLPMMHGDHLASNVFTVLRDITFIDDLQEKMILIENCANPDAYEKCTELFSLYITQQATKLAHRPMWLCICAYNQSLGTSWPGLSDDVCHDM